MTAQEIRNKYLQFQVSNGHVVIPRAKVIPENDPTTLFTSSGMQQLLPYLLGETHPKGTRLTDSQTCLRAQDIEDVGDNRHTTFFEMLGNWSLGDYFKKEQLPWVFSFLIDEVGLDPNRLYITCYNGNTEFNIPKDTEAAEIWVSLFAKKGIEAKEVVLGPEENGYKVGMQGGRIFYYNENWWSRGGDESQTPVGDPCGPDSEMMYEFPEVEHDTKFGPLCHPACDCGRYLEIGNSVFMTYRRTQDGFEKLDKPNVDFGGGLERIAAAKIDSPDVFKISLLWPIIAGLEKATGKNYDDNKVSMRVVADHLRAATFMAVDGITPSNKEQGYVMRRLLRRAIRYAFDLGIEQGLCETIVPVIADMYHEDYPEVAEHRDAIVATLVKEEKVFRQTLRKGIQEFAKLTEGGALTGEIVFKLYDTFGFPVELTLEEAEQQNKEVPESIRADFDALMAEQRARSQTAAKGVFKGGLADHGEISTKYHTATHLMYKALRLVLGDHVIQRGSNITEERLRFDFTHPEKVTPEQIAEIERIVNEQIEKDWPMGFREENTKEALAAGVMGAFGDKYGDTVKVYTVGEPDGEHYSREICGGPHVAHTGMLAEQGKKFKITKEEASSAGVRRIKAILA